MEVGSPCTLKLSQVEHAAGAAVAAAVEAFTPTTVQVTASKH